MARLYTRLTPRTITKWNICSRPPRTSRSSITSCFEIRPGARRSSTWRPTSASTSDIEKLSHQSQVEVEMLKQPCSFGDERPREPALSLSKEMEQQCSRGDGLLLRPGRAQLSKIRRTTNEPRILYQRKSSQAAEKGLQHRRLAGSREGILLSSTESRKRTAPHSRDHRDGFGKGTSITQTTANLSSRAE